MLSRIIEVAKENACREVIGQYIATERNEPAADFLERHAFQRSGDGGWWSLGLDEGEIKCPSWITMADSDVTAS